MPHPEPSPLPRFAILGSGRGSNAVALMAEFRRGALPAELAVVVANVKGAAILEHASRAGYATALIESAGRSRLAHEELCLMCLREHHVEHLLLAGYMRILSPEFIAGWPGVILNIHPALLPDFRGRDAVAQQWQAGVRVAGATVHFVDAGVDTGPPLLCGSIAVRGDEGEAGLAERIRSEVEHVIYPRAVRLLLERLARGGPLHGQDRSSP